MVNHASLQHDPHPDHRQVEALRRLTRTAVRALRARTGLLLLPGAATLIESGAGVPRRVSSRIRRQVEGLLSDPAGPPELCISAAPAEDGEPVARVTGIEACLALTLRDCGGERVGVLAVVRDAPSEWSEDERCGLRDVGALVARELECQRATLERRRAADTHRQNEERFRLMIEGSEQVFFYIHDEAGRFEYVSPSVAGVLGYTPAELVGRPYTVLLTGDASDAVVAEQTARALQGEHKPSTYVAVTRHKDGRTVPIELVESALRRDGRVVGVQGLARDITERKRAEAELRIRTAHLEHLIESAPEAIVLLDNTQRVLRVNREFSRMFGYTAREALGRPIDELIVHPEQFDESGEYGDRVARGETIGVRAVRMRKDGRPIHVSILATPIVVDGHANAIYGIYRDISAQVRAEEAVRSSEEHFRSLIEYSTEVINVLDEEGTIRYASPSSERVLGYAHDEIVGRRFDAFVHPDDHELAARSFTARVGTPFSVGTTRLRILHKDGGFRIFEAVGRNLLEHSAVGGIVITSRDVTSREEAEAELRRNAAILASIRDSVAVTDLDGVITYWNDGATRLFGWTAAEILGQPLRSRLPVEMHARLDAEAGRVLAGEEIHGEYEDVRKDGSRILTDTRVSLIRDEAGTPIAILRIARDITEQRLLGRVLEEMPDSVFFLDAEDRIVSINAAAERTLGYSADELCGRHVSILDGSSGERATQPLAAVLATTRSEGGWSGEVLQRRKDGFQFPARLTTAVVRDSQGKVIGLAGLLHDLTEQKLRERHLRRAERLASVGTLLSGIAHELNNPLTSIKSFSQLMLFDERSEEDREALEVIHRESDRAARIVADLRVIARQTLEVEVGPKEAVDLNELVRAVLARRAQQRTEPFEVRADLSQELVAVWGERHRLEQMIHQLVVNGEQAIPEGAATRRLIVRTRPRRKGVSLSVIDSGAGIPQAHLERIFDPFWTTREPGEGMGLGLSLVHSIVTEHGGEIRVESELGRGSAFTVELPWSTEPQPGALPRGGRDRATTPLRVLLVEDEAPISLSLARFLERRGHHVDTADRGAEALRRIDAGIAYDVIVSDLCMPGLSGTELFDRLAARGDGTERRMIIVTGDPALAESAVVTAAGVPVVSKPFVLPEIAELIEQHAAHCASFLPDS